MPAPWPADSQKGFGSFPCRARRKLKSIRNARPQHQWRQHLRLFPHHQQAVVRDGFRLLWQFSQRNDSAVWARYEVHPAYSKPLVPVRSQYFLKVVATDVQPLGGEVLQTYQYSVTKHTEKLSEYEATLPGNPCGRTKLTL